MTADQRWYSVYIERRGDDPSVITEDALDVFTDSFASEQAVVSGGGGLALYGARLSVESETAFDAMATAAAFVSSAAVDAGLPDWETVQVDVTQADVLDEELARRQLPDIVSAPDVADILGVTPQRVHTLASGNKRFPRPIFALRTGKIWLRAAVEKFNAEWDRKPGRPSSAREEILAVAQELADRSEDGAFALTDLVAELQKEGSRYAESTIRTHVTSRMCGDAPAHHGTTYDDFERLGGGRYRFRSLS